MIRLSPGYVVGSCIPICSFHSWHNYGSSHPVLVLLSIVWFTKFQLWLITTRSHSQVPSSREPVMFQYMPPGPNEESLQLNSGHHPSRMGNGTPSSYMVLPSKFPFAIALFPVPCSCRGSCKVCGFWIHHWHSLHLIFLSVTQQGCVSSCVYPESS